MGGDGIGLVADVGGTNARFALVEAAGGRRRLTSVQQLSCANFPSFEATLDSYLSQVGAKPRRGIIAVAGAVRDDAVHFTNLDWRISHDSLTRSGFPGIHLINDYAAQALALPLLDPEWLCPLGTLTTSGIGSLAVFGPGSGLGVAALVRQSGHAVPLPTEGGHADFAPVDATDIGILQILTARYGRVSNETLMSGPGLCRLHDALRELAGEPRVGLTASQISERALAGDPACLATVHRFCAILGSVAGSVALTLGAFGGVFIAGGIAPRILPILKDSEFRQRFEAKGPMSGLLQATPTLVITDTNSALLGAASLLDLAS